MKSIAPHCPSESRVHELIFRHAWLRFGTVIKSITTPLLVLSLVINIVVGLKWYQGSQRAVIPVEETSNTTLNQPGEEKKTEPDTPEPAAAPKAPSTTFDWQLVESDDYRDYIANLRSIGCPEETIRDIIKADVDKLYKSKSKELQPETEPFEYWKTGNSWMAAMQPNSESMQAQSDLNKEKRNVLKTLLGEDYEPETSWMQSMVAFDPFERMLDSIPSNKRASIMEIYQTFAVKQAELAQGGTMDQEDMKAMADLQRERNAELAGLLSPEEFRDFELRMSETSMMLRSQMNGFQPTKEEFEQIFDLKKVMDGEFGSYGMAMTNSEDRERYQSAQQTFEDGVKSVLGEERYGDYKMSQDYTYQGIKKTAERNDIDVAVAKDLYQSMKTAQETANQVRNNQQLDTAQKREMLQGIRSETEALFVESIGQEGFETYNNRSHSGRVRNLECCGSTQLWIRQGNAVMSYCPPRSICYLWVHQSMSSRW